MPPTCISGTTPIVCNAVTIDPELNYYWHGIDTNFVWRGPFGIRVNGGTNTGRTSRETCATMNDAPAVRGREGNPYQGSPGGLGVPPGLPGTHDLDDQAQRVGCLRDSQG